MYFGSVKRFKFATASHSPLSDGSPTSPSTSAATVDTLAEKAFEVGLKALLLCIPSKDSMKANRATISAEVPSDVDGVSEGSVSGWRALDRGVNMQLLLFLLHRLQGPSRSGSHFIFKASAMGLDLLAW